MCLSNAAAKLTASGETKASESRVEDGILGGDKTEEWAKTDAGSSNLIPRRIQIGIRLPLYRGTRRSGTVGGTKSDSNQILKRWRPATQNQVLSRPLRQAITRNT